MDQLVTAIPWGDVGPTGLLTLTVLAIIQGWLVPRRTYDALVADRDYWRSTATEQATTVAELTEVSRAAVAALDALPKPDDGT